jgi:hypothetical protein
MSIIGSELLLGSAAATGYQIERSLRFNANTSNYLQRTPASVGNRKTWTLSFWMKVTDPTISSYIFQSRVGTSDSTWFEVLYSSGTIYIGGYSIAWRNTTAQFRDTTAWYHIVISVDTTSAVANDRIKIYVNGTQQTSFSILNNPALNLDLAINNTQTHYFSNTVFFNGYLADIYLIDGQALTPSSFAETNATTQQWVPKAYTGSFGTNGFWLKFSDNSAATSTTLGKDYSGNSNNWTPQFFSVTAGVNNDSFVDSPTSYGTDTGAGGEVRGNYATWNSLKPLVTNLSLSNGALYASGTSNYNALTNIPFPGSGKWYMEVTVVSAPGFSTQEVIGIATDISNRYGAVARGYASNGQYYNGSAWVAFGSSWSTNNVIGIAVNVDASQLSFYKNGVQQGTTQSYSFSANKSCLIVTALNTGTTEYYLNAGQRPFTYTAPSGFKTLCDTNLPAPTIANPNIFMNSVVYQGTGSAQTISGLAFSPDFVWIKRRDGVQNHMLFDIIRGAGNVINSNQTSVAYSASTELTSFNSSGFSLGTGASTNANGDQYVAWNWDAGSSTVTNTQGSITSQVRANTSAGFSVVTYTGTGTTATVGHGLGVAPGLILCKSRTLDNYWAVYHQSAGTGFLQLSSNAAYNSTAMWASGPTSTVINFNSGGYGANNATGIDYVAYCFAPVDGYSSFGIYEGNGNTVGPFVYTGFRPQWLLIKRTDALGNWNMADSKRPGYNSDNYYLLAESSAAEGSSGYIDFLSNGFKPRITYGWINANGGSFVYAAFAQNPFQYARAR